MAPKKMKNAFNPQSFLSKAGKGRTIAEYGPDQIIYLQKDPSDAVFYVQTGKVKSTVVSKHGKEAVLAILGARSFFGECCLSGQNLRMSAMTTITKCSLMRIEKTAMLRLLRDEETFSEQFMAHILSRNNKLQEDLVDQLFNSSERRLARALLLLANIGKQGPPTPISVPVSQEMLAAMIGTTRSRVNTFMNKFRRLGFIEYRAGDGGLRIHRSLLNVIVRD